jgi:hypothetical protein
MDPRTEQELVRELQQTRFRTDLDPEPPRAQPAGLPGQPPRVAAQPAMALPAHPPLARPATPPHQATGARPRGHLVVVLVSVGILVALLAGGIAIWCLAGGSALTPIRTEMTLDVFDPTSVSGEAIELTVTIRAHSPGTSKPTGHVIFKRGTKVLGTEPLEDGIAVLEIDDLPAGAHTIQAVYVPDPPFSASTASCTHTIKPDQGEPEEEPDGDPDPADSDEDSQEQKPSGKKPGDLIGRWLRVRVSGGELYDEAAGVYEFKDPRTCLDPTGHERHYAQAAGQLALFYINPRRHVDELMERGQVHWRGGDRFEYVIVEDRGSIRREGWKYEFRRLH